MADRLDLADVPGFRDLAGQCERAAGTARRLLPTETPQAVQVLSEFVAVAELTAEAARRLADLVEQRES